MVPPYNPPKYNPPRHMYKIIKALTIWGLEREANKLIDKGFIPTGGVSTKWGFYTQAFYIPKQPLR